jgi:hypothetical protein
MLKTRLSHIVSAAVCVVILGIALVELSSLYPKIFAALDGVIIATAALATAYFTGTIWNVNKSQLRHSHRIERAYMSGGGYRVKHPVAMSAHQTPILGETGEFQFCVNNYGKTPGILCGLGYAFCEESAIPQVPNYTFLYLHSYIDPGRSGLPIISRPVPKEYTRPVVYGRFYYETIFGTRHSSGFLYRILPNQQSESIQPPSAVYIRDQDEEQSGDGIRVEMEGKKVQRSSHKPIVVRVFGRLKRKRVRKNGETEHQRNAMP